jgi:two-component system sensor histidine kinase BaeS
VLRSIPRQLLLSYLAIVLVCLGLCSWAILDLVRAQNVQRLTAEMEQQGSFLATLLGRHDRIGGLTALSSSEKRLLAEAMIRFSLDGLVIVGPRAEGNRLLYSSLYRTPRELEAVANSAGPEIERARDGVAVSEVRRVPPLDPATAEAAAIPVLISASPIVRDGRVVGVLAMRRPLADVDLLVLTLSRTLLLLGVIAAGVARVLGTRLAHLLTRPIRQIGEAAARIAEGHLDERLDVRGATELEQLGNAFNRMAESLQEQERIRARFIGDASHELKTPLSSLKALLEALERGAGTDPQRAERFYALMRGEVDRLDMLVRDLLDLHRFDAGAAAIRREPVAVDALLEDVAEQVRPMLPGGSLEVDSCRVMVDADPARLRQVLLNLVDNARRAVRGLDAPRIELSAAVEDGACVLRVVDNGPGIPLADRERIFERFTRLDGGRTRAEGGTGLGLAIARSIAEAHGGRLVVEDGPGTRMALCLPPGTEPRGLR